MEKIKLIWDFRGPAAEKTAEHHIIHLKEFAEKEKLTFENSVIEKYNELLCSASVVINKSNLDKIKIALKPHRGQLV